MTSLTGCVYNVDMKTNRFRITPTNVLASVALILTIASAGLLVRTINEPSPYDVCQNDGIYHACHNADTTTTTCVMLVPDGDSDADTTAFNEWAASFKTVEYDGGPWYSNTGRIVGWSNGETGAIWETEGCAAAR